MINRFHIRIKLKNSILIGLLFFIFSCNKKIELHIEKTIIFEGKLYELDKDVPFSGVLYNLYSNGNREYKGEYKNGRPNGLLTYWYENGNKKREGKLKSGSPIGKWKYYNEDGTLKSTVDH